MADKKTLAVVGAGPLIGMAMARRFGREGYRVGLIARNQERLDSYVKELEDSGIEAGGWVADVRNRPQLVEAIEGINDRFGRIDVLEYSPMVGNDDLQTVVNIDDKNILTFLDYYVLGPIVAVRAVLDQMVERGDGALLFTSGASAKAVMPSHGNVSVAMGGLRQYVRMLNAQLESNGVYAGSIIISKVHDPEELAELYWDMTQKRDRVEEFYGIAEIGEAYEVLVARGYGPGFPPGLTKELPEPKDEAERRTYLLGLYQARTCAVFHPDPAAAEAAADAEAARFGGNPAVPYYGVAI
jgi:NADP-dependent 3-hydroxy acid dehydrogenase YdfG